MQGPALPLTVAYIGWAVLLVALALGLVRGLRAAVPHRRTLVLAAAGVLVVALAVRLALPFTPLHANSHAYEDIAVALAHPDASELSHDFIRLYGPSWWAGQRLAMSITGAHHDGLGLADVAFGSLAVLLAFLAALRFRTLTRPRLALATAIVLVGAAVPVGARVGHSESVFAVAQFLVAAVLVLAGWRGKVATAGYIAAVGLLATGHLAGPLLAVAAVLVGWSVTPRPPAAGWGLGRTLAGLAVVGAAAATALLNHEGAIRGRLGGHIFQLSPFEHLLWLDPDWSSYGVLAVALLGALALACPAAVHEALPRRLLRALASGAGLAAGVAAGLLVLANVSDGLRYQSPLAPMLMALGVACTRLPPVLPAAWRRPAWSVLATLALVSSVEVLRLPAGLTRLDVQAHQYHVLRATLADEGDKFVALIEPPRPADQKMIKMPVGRLAGGGPSLLAIPPEQIPRFCDRGPAPLVFVPAEATIARSRDGRLVSEQLDDLIDETQPVLRGEIVQAPHGPLQNEFHSAMPDPAGWTLGRALCPRRP